MNNEFRDNIILEPPLEEIDFEKEENFIAKNVDGYGINISELESLFSLTDFQLEKQKVAYHDHEDQMPEHPVAVKDHQEWFNNLFQQGGWGTLLSSLDLPTLNQYRINTQKRLSILLTQKKVLVEKNISGKITSFESRQLNKILKIIEMNENFANIIDKTIKNLIMSNKYMRSREKPPSNEMEMILRKLVQVDKGYEGHVFAMESKLKKLPILHFQKLSRIIISETVLQGYEKELQRSLGGGYDDERKEIVIVPGEDLEEETNIIHEMGHHVALTLFSEDDKKLVEVAFKDSVQTGNGFVSEYSQQDKDEYIAECYRAYVKNTVAFRKKNLVVANIFDRYWK